MIKSHRPDEDSILLTVHAARIDAAVAMAFKEEARRIIAEEAGRVILDLQEVEFLDSSGRRPQGSGVDAHGQCFRPPRQDTSACN
jgi:hypothetical protein